MLNQHLPWLFVLILISVQSHVSAVGSALDSSDKITHLIVFGLLAWLLTRAIFKGKNTFLQRNYFWIVLFVLAIFALLDEIHQYYIPGRATELLDWLADMTGGLIFLLIYRWRFRVNS